jgi:hypothetical protein
MLFIVGIVLVFVGTAHLDDHAATHVRLGWGCLAAGLVLLALAVWEDRRA